jgi:hypothetical protein
LGFHLCWSKYNLFWYQPNIGIKLNIDYGLVYDMYTSSLILVLPSKLLLNVLIIIYFYQFKLNLNFYICIEFWHYIFVWIFSFNWKHEEWWRKWDKYVWFKNIMHKMFKFIFKNILTNISILNHISNDKDHVWHS